MNSFYSFLTGPMVWIAFIIFFGGLLVKFGRLVSLAKNKDPFIFNYMSAKYGLRSILMWLIPFVPRNMRLNPVMTVAMFAFHICLFIAPLFLSAHIIMLQDGIGLSWPTLPDGVADVMTVIALVCIGYFAYRRLAVPEAKYVTTAADFLLLALVAAPFVTGFLAYHQILDYKWMITLHVLFGELMLILIPFTWLAHMMLGPMVRIYAGSEFGAERHVKDW